MDGAPPAADGGIQVEETPEPPFAWREHGLEDGLAFALFWGLTVIVFLQFFTRYVLNNSFAWTEEAARYFLIATTFIGGGLVCRRRAHIAVEYLHTLLPREASRWLMVLVDALTALFLGYMGWITWRLTSLMAPQKMAVIDLSMSWLYWVVLVGLVVMMARTLHSMVRRIGGDSPYAGDV